MAEKRHDEPVDTLSTAKTLSDCWGCSENNPRDSPATRTGRAPSLVLQPAQIAEECGMEDCDAGDALWWARRPRDDIGAVVCLADLGRLTRRWQLGESA